MARIWRWLSSRLIKSLDSRLIASSASSFVLRSQRRRPLDLVLANPVMSAARQTRVTHAWMHRQMFTVVRDLPLPRMKRQHHGLTAARRAEVLGHAVFKADGVKHHEALQSALDETGV